MVIVVVSFAHGFDLFVIISVGANIFGGGTYASSKICFRLLMVGIYFGNWKRAWGLWVVDMVAIYGGNGEILLKK